MYHYNWKNNELIYEFWKSQAYSRNSADLDMTTRLLFHTSVTYIRVTGHFIFQPYRYVVACVT